LTHLNTSVKNVQKPKDLASDYAKRVLFIGVTLQISPVLSLMYLSLEAHDVCIYFVGRATSLWISGEEFLCKHWEIS